MNDMYNKYLEFFMENNIILNEGLLDKLKRNLKERKEHQLERKRIKEQQQRERFANDVLYTLKNFIKYGTFYGVRLGDIQYTLQALKECNISEKFIIDKSIASKYNKPVNIFEYIYGGIYEEQIPDETKKKLESEFDRNSKCIIISNDDDELVPFISLKNRKCYTFLYDPFNSEFNQLSSIYDLADDWIKDYMDWDDEFINKCKEIIKNKGK